MIKGEVDSSGEEVIRHMKRKARGAFELALEAEGYFKRGILCLSGRVTTLAPSGYFSPQRAVCASQLEGPFAAILACMNIAPIDKLS